MSLRGWIKKKRTALGWWLLDLEPEQKEICQAALDSGWFARQVRRLNKFCKEQTSQCVHAAHLFELMYGRDVKFEVEPGGLARDMYNGPSLVEQFVKERALSEPEKT